MADVHRMSTGRVYEVKPDGEGCRALADHICPRGLSKEKTHIDQWSMTAAPSTRFSNRGAHDLESFEEFGFRCPAEPGDAEPAKALEHPSALTGPGNPVPLTAPGQLERSEAEVFADLLGA